jgi:hypothetical protein
MTDPPMCADPIPVEHRRGSLPDHCPTCAQPSTPAPNGGDALTDEVETVLREIVDAHGECDHDGEDCLIPRARAALAAVRVTRHDAIKAAATALYSCGVQVPEGVSYAGVVRSVILAARAAQPVTPDVDRLNREHPLDGGRP